jgi:antitoxin component HigA of HigAB toxin-antitoxin module
MASNAASLNRAKGLKGRYSKILKEEKASTIDNDRNRNERFSISC